jgi:hypothetical protein
MVGFLFNKFFQEDASFNKRLITIPFHLLLSSLLATCLLVPFISQNFREDYRQAFHFYPLVLVLGFGSSLAFLSLLKKRVFVSFTLLIMIMTGSFLYAVESAFPSMNEFKSARPFSLRIKSYMKEGDLLTSFRLHTKTPAFNFYTGIKEIKRFETPNELVTYLTQPDKRIFCLMRQKYFQKLLMFSQIPFFQWDVAKIGRRKIVLISNFQKEG